eukprot:c21459_g1_i1.p1 GENE.c21459_g1_i1~~c21459_g1_i1.p1  ORF type:complete len:308 (-),score=106.53 c21459_g1_i1:47-970(-)
MTSCIEWLEMAKQGKILDEILLKKLANKVAEILIEEPNLVQITPPVVIVGDVHGQFHDLREMFKVIGEAPEKQFLFLGDYVDRGANSLETLVLLLCMKACYPSRITLLRGNHECRQITSAYGFLDECLRKYGTTSAWSLCCDLFDLFPISALVDNKIFCVHGGISPDLPTLDSIYLVNRQQELPIQGKLCDLMWSDPEEHTNLWSLNTRGAGYLFGEQAATAFNHANGLELVCRSHQLSMEGFQYHFNSKNVLTVWSAPNYCYRCGNKATVLELNDRLERNLSFFEEVSSTFGVTAKSVRSGSLYFL